MTVHNTQLPDVSNSSDKRAEFTENIASSFLRALEPSFHEKKMNYQKNTADLSASERLKLSLILTLTVKLLNHEISPWYFVLHPHRVHS